MVSWSHAVIVSHAVPISCQDQTAQCSAGVINSAA